MALADASLYRRATQPCDGKATCVIPARKTLLAKAAKGRHGSACGRVRFGALYR